MTTHLDPARLARAQLDSDVKTTARFPGLLDRKIARMTVSSHAFLRGSAPMFYDVLAARPDLTKGGDGEGWIAGDLHLENFGAYRTDGHAPESRVAFGMSDFDEAIVAPWRIDLLRLTTSLLLATRGFGVAGARAGDLAFSMLRAYANDVSGSKEKTPTPRMVTALVEQVRERTRLQLLDARTEVRHGKRAFVRGPRYRSISSTLAKQAKTAFVDYIKASKLVDLADSKHFDILDVAQRIAGTGSLGCVRIAVLTAGKGGRDDAFVFDMKEEGSSAAASFGKAPKGDAANRVIDAMRTSLASPPRMLGSTHIG
ncbi:MAG: DUF2252 family protein, partial [Polyangiaceae bacterium]